jgi:hypothetical protein
VTLGRRKLKFHGENLLELCKKISKMGNVVQGNSYGIFLLQPHQTWELLALRKPVCTGIMVRVIIRTARKEMHCTLV